LFLVADIIELYLYVLLHVSPTLNIDLSIDLSYSNKGLDVEISAANMPLHNCIK